MGAVTFYVQIKGTDTPPGWEDQMEKALRSEMRLRFGDMAAVVREHRRPHEPPIFSPDASVGDVR
jgi:hypothetical protein